MNVNKFVEKINKVDKVELSKIEIELSVFEDLKKSSDAASKLASNAFQDLQKAAQNVVDIAGKFESQAENISKSLDSDMKKYAAAAKELGFDHKNNLIYTGADRELEQMEELISSCKKIKGVLKGGAIGNI